MPGLARITATSSLREVVEVRVSARGAARLEHGGIRRGRRRRDAAASLPPLARL